MLLISFPTRMRGMCISAANRNLLKAPDDVDLNHILMFEVLLNKIQFIAMLSSIGRGRGWSLLELSTKCTKI